MSRLTSSEGKAIAAILNSTVGTHTAGKKTVVITGLADDTSGKAGVTIKTDTGKELVFLGIDIKKRYAILNYGSGLAENAISVLQDQNHSSVFSAAKAQRIALSSYVAWEIVTDKDLMNSLPIVHKGGLKTGQIEIRSLTIAEFENAAIKALSYLELDQDVISAIDWLSDEVKTQLLIPELVNNVLNDDVDYEMYATCLLSNDPNYRNDSEDNDTDDFTAYLPVTKAKTTETV